MIKIWLKQLTIGSSLKLFVKDMDDVAYELGVKAL